MSRRRNDSNPSIVGTVFGIIFALAILGAGGYALYLAMTGEQPEFLRPIFAPETLEEPVVEEPTLAPKPFADYSWDELGQISDLITAAADSDAAYAVAHEFGLVGDDGRITTDTLLTQLDDGTIVDVHLVGILHDDRADGSGKAGLTFMAGIMAQQPMEPTASVEGGWRDSQLRGWLGSTGIDLLPDDLAKELVIVTKTSNNFGGWRYDRMDERAIEDFISTTDDSLWLFAAHEVCGDCAWMVGEYGAGYMMGTSDRYDAIVNAEGTQYEAFWQAGITNEGDISGLLAMRDKGAASAWWYRTPHPVLGRDGEPELFYQVMASGHPFSVAQADAIGGVVVGFCI